MSAAKRKGKKKGKKQQKLEPRTPWHMILVLLLQERAPEHFSVKSEVPLGKELPRADVVLLRRDQRADDDEGKVLQKLWSMIRQDAVVEFKSVSRGFERGELGKLLGYAGLYFCREVKRLERRESLLTALLVPKMTPTLKEELTNFGLVESANEGGYRRYVGGSFPLAVIEVDEVAQQERDELLGFLGHHMIEGEEARLWLLRVMGQRMGKLKELDDFEGFEAKAVAVLGDKVLASMTPEQRLAGLDPEQRLAGLEPEQVLRQYDPNQRLAGLDPEQRLAGLDPEQVAEGLSEEQKAALRKLLDDMN